MLQKSYAEIHSVRFVASREEFTRSFPARGAAYRSGPLSAYGWHTVLKKVMPFIPEFEIVADRVTEMRHWLSDQCERRLLSGAQSSLQSDLPDYL